MASKFPEPHEENERNPGKIVEADRFGDQISYEFKKGRIFVKAIFK